MPEPSDHPPASDEAFHRALADLLEALARGEPVDPAAWRARFPGFDAELADFLAARAAVEGAAAPLRRAAPDDRTPTAPPGAPPRHGAAPPPPPLGALGNYELLEELGKGGMGRVYKARDTVLGRLVAVKVLRAGELEAESTRLRFRTEAEAVARLDHPNIVPVYEVGDHGGRPYLVMGLVEGGSLGNHLPRFGQDPRAAAALVATLARAVHHAHQRGVLHRDLKPGNVLLQARGLQPLGLAVPKIADFGLAKLLGADAKLTRTGDLLGTPSYMAPEQAGGSAGAVTTATDVHGLGAILYALLTGRPPFAGGSLLETLEQVKGRDPVAPRRLNARVDRDLETVCLTCLAKDPHRRYGSAEALADDLERWLACRTIVARPSTPPQRLARWVRRRPAASALVLVSALALLGGLAGSLWHNREQGRTLHELGQALGESGRLRKEGLAREDRLRQLLYVADVKAAKAAWDWGNFAQARELLDRQRPAEGEEDLRGFEWYWLWACCQPEKASFQAHDGGLLCAAVSPDERFLVTGDHKGAVKVWDLAGLREVASLVGHTDEVQRAAFSRDGRALATCSKDRTIRLWEVATWRQAARLEGHLMTVTSVAFSPDGALLASCDRDRRITLWQLPQGRPLRTWLGHEDVVHDVGFTPDGRTLVSVGKDNSARLWEVASGRELRKLSQDTGKLLRLAVSADGRTLATGGYDHQVQLWKLAEASGPINLAGSNTRSLAFSPDSTVLAGVGSDGFLSFWTVGPGGGETAAPRVTHLGEGGVKEVAFAHGGATVVLGLEGGVVRLWDRDRFRGWEVLAASPSDIIEVAFSPDGRQAAWVTDEGSVHLWDMAARRPVRAHRLTGSPTPNVLFGPAGQILAAASQSSIQVWDTGTGQEVLSLKGHKAGVNGIAFSPAGDLLAASFSDGSVGLWEYPSGVLRSTFPAHASSCLSVAFADDQSLVVTGADGTVSLWDPRTGLRKALLEGHGHSVEELDVTPDGRVLASGDLAGVMKLWDLKSGRELWASQRRRGHVRGMALAPDGRTLASCRDGTMKLWHAATGQELFSLPGDTPHRGVTFSPDGRTLLAGIDSRGAGSPAAVCVWKGDAPGR
jgi:WD40 repeat protein/tRNA A-37 threonylcarbamoyl transferase component Bud32